MPHPTLPRAVALLAALAAFACSDTPTDGGGITTPPPPQAADTLRIRYEASGIGSQARLDLSIDGTLTDYRFAAPKTFDVTVPSGRHELRIGGLPAWCRAESPTTTVETKPGAVVPVAFTVTCSGFRLHTQTTGFALDSDGYYPIVDEVSLADNALAASGDNLVNVSPGRHRVRLGGVASHCTASPASIELDVLPTGTADPVSFSIACAGAAVVAAVTTTGFDFDGDGYELSLVDPQRRVVSVTPTAAVAITSLGAWPAGTQFDVVLSGLAKNCTADAVARPTLVPAADTVTVRFGVTCTALPPGGILVGLESDDGEYVTYRLVEPFQDYSVAREASGAEWTPDRSGYAFTQFDRLYLGRTSSIDVRPLGTGTNPAFSPNGSKLYFTHPFDCFFGCNYPREVYVMDPTASVPSPAVAFRAARLVSFDISPDGSRIAYVVDPTGAAWTYELRVARLDGTEARTLLTGVGSDRPRFSPDGTRVLVTALEYDGAFFRASSVVVGIDGSTRGQVGLGDDRALAWSPDGTRVLVSAGLHKLVSMRATDGGDRRELLATPMYIRNASWR